jgi:hypothetical protein
LQFMLVVPRATSFTVEKIANWKMASVAAAG